jgi:drug/metabolite transporter (DMT)-like permease
MTSRDFLIGAGWAVAAAAFHSMVPIGVRLVSERLPPIEIVFFRNAVGFSVFLAFFAWRGFHGLGTQRIGLHIQRNVANFVGMWLWFAALAAMPVGKAVALHFTEPLMATVLAIFFLGERPGLHRWLGIAAGFAGALVVLRPGAVPISWGAMMVLGSALLYAMVTVYSRELGRTEAPSTTTFYYQAMLTAFALVPALMVWVAPGWADVPGLLLVAASGTLAPYCIIRAIRSAEASALSPISFLRLPITASFAWLLFAETTDTWTWVGAAMIFFSAYAMGWAERRARLRVEAESGPKMS